MLSLGFNKTLIHQTLQVLVAMTKIIIINVVGSKIKTAVRWRRYYNRPQ